MKIHILLVVLSTFILQDFSYSGITGVKGQIVEMGTKTDLVNVTDISWGKKLFNKAKASTFLSGMYYALSAAAMAQSLLNIKSSRRSRQAASHVDDSGNPLNNSDGQNGGSGGNSDSNSGSPDIDSFSIDNPPTDAEFLASLSPEVREEFGDDIVNPYTLAKELRDKGYEFDEKTGGVKMPDGSTMSASQLNAEAKKIASTKEFQAYQKALEQKKRNVIQRLKSGEQGAYAGRGNESTESKSNAANSFFGFNSGVGSREPASANVEQEVSYINGEPTPHVSGSLFKTMKDAYQDLLSNKTLINSTK